jgi:hypothetical protein
MERVLAQTACPRCEGLVFDDVATYVYYPQGTIIVCATCAAPLLVDRDMNRQAGSVPTHRITASEALRLGLSRRKDLLEKMLAVLTRDP